MLLVWSCTQQQTTNPCLCWPSVIDRILLDVTQGMCDMSQHLIVTMVHIMTRLGRWLWQSFAVIQHFLSAQRAIFNSLRWHLNIATPTQVISLHFFDILAPASWHVQCPELQWLFRSWAQREKEQYKKGHLSGPILSIPFHSFPFLFRLFVGTNWNLQVRPVTPFHLSPKTWQWLLRFDNDRDPNNAKRVETGNWLRYFRFSSVHWRMAIVSFGGWLLASMGLFRSTLTISPAICKHHKNNFLCSSYFVRVLLVAFDNWLDIVEVCQTQSADSPPFSKDFSVMSGKYLNEMDCIGVNPWNLWSTFPAQHCLLRPSYCKGPYFAGSVSSFSRKTPSSVIFACSCNEVEQHEEAATTGNENFSHWLRKLGNIRNHQATAFM